MIRNKIAKIGAVAVGLSLAFGASTAGAQTIAELQAQINALLAQLSALQGGSTTTTTTACTFTRSLTVGASGADVTCLQQYLQGTGHFTFSGGATGFFGPVTRSAVAAWQAANGVAPAVGYFGPVSQARYRAVAGTTTGGGVVVTPPSSTPGITTPGVEGTITVTKAASPASGTTLYEGDTRRAVLGLEIEAKTSDMRIERVKVDLDCVTCSPGSDTDLYRKIANRIYVMDGSNVLASMDLNNSTVVEDGADYFITVAGFNFVVPKGTKKVLTLALDAASTWDSTYDGDSWSLGIPTDGVRSVDGAGVNQYGPSTAFTNSFTTQGELAESATVTASLNINTPQAADVVCALGADEDECDNLEALRVDFRAEKDDVIITDLVIDITRGGTLTTATATTAYLYDGSTLVGSDAVDGTSTTVMGATFSNIDWRIPKDTTKTLMVKLDIDDAGTAATTFVVDIDTADITAENSLGDGITESGSATGETLTVRKVGPEFKLVGGSITKSETARQAASSTNSSSGTVSTTTAAVKFVVRTKAVGGDIIFGDSASTTVPMFSNAGGSHDDDPSFHVYRNGGILFSTGAASSTSITVPTGVSNVTNNSFTLQEGNTVDIEVEFILEGRTTAGALLTLGSYAVGISQINWVSSTGIQESSSMIGELPWIVGSVVLP